MTLHSHVCYGDIDPHVLRTPVLTSEESLSNDGVYAVLISEFTLETPVGEKSGISRFRLYGEGGGLLSVLFDSYPVPFRLPVLP